MKAEGRTYLGLGTLANDNYSDDGFIRFRNGSLFGAKIVVAVIL